MRRILKFKNVPISERNESVYRVSDRFINMFRVSNESRTNIS